MGWSWLLVQSAVWGSALLLVTLAWLSWLWVTRPRLDAPGPPTLPLIGNILDLYQVPVSMSKVRDLHRQYGDLIRLYLGPVLVAMVSHPDDVRQVLLTTRQVERDPYTTHAFHTLLGDGLLSLNGHHWKAHRKSINPTFHSELLGGFLEAFHQGGLFLSERLARSKGVPAEVHPPALLTSIRGICNTLVGINPDRLIPDAIAEAEIADAICSAMTAIQKMVVQPWWKRQFLLQLTSKGYTLFKFKELLKKQAMLSIGIRSSATEEGSENSRLRLLEALVKPGGQTMLPLSEVRDELVTMAIAGSETSAMTLSYVLAMLSLHPEWQDATQQELREVFGEGEDYLRAATLADLNSLRVLESIIKETQRLFPAVPLIPRIATEDIRLSGERVLVPKGTVLAVMPSLTHRLPQFFPDPLKFDPTRFLEGHVSKEHLGSFLPFGLGPRNCVGSQYARLQLKVLLAAVLRRFRLLPHTSREDLEEGILSASLHPVKPIKVCCLPLQDPVPKDHSLHHKSVPQDGTNISSGLLNGSSTCKVQC